MNLSSEFIMQTQYINLAFFFSAQDIGVPSGAVGLNVAHRLHMVDKRAEGTAVHPACPHIVLDMAPVVLTVPLLVMRLLWQQNLSNINKLGKSCERSKNARSENSEKT